VRKVCAAAATCTVVVVSGRPMVIEPARWADWLDPGNSDKADLLALLAPATSGGLASYPVSMAVNSVRNNGPDLMEPLATEPAGTGHD